MTQQVPEEELIQRIIDGDKQLFSVIVDRYKHKVYGIMRGMGASHPDAQDLAQDTFIRIYRYLPTRREGSSFSAWVYTIAVNMMRDHMRRVKSTTTRVNEESYTQGIEESTPEKQILQQEMKREIYRHLEQLPDSYRLVLLLKYTNELSYEEISEVTGMSAAQIRNALYRGKKSLQKQLKQARGEWSYEV
ncbi:MAG: sigma-70 family RNA polymerase sigma factor [Paenibacillus sp.]|uniref:RNA polymerase sigma factor n=1 Tax=Paenibacillus sp. TaxID=58172 RepID=UPI0025EA747B|nr:sigma-70 family RNA polymerase sigma factor [Paenibacillus sp.]MBR2567274.1 sigma-70 family RNA polymerase sigma factor [Paenibacillus sp.]